jgi:hypothetical protein
VSSNEQAVAQKALTLKPKSLREVCGAGVLRFYFGLDSVDVEGGKAVR